MKTKWGSCNPGGSQVWINLELAKKSPKALEYVILHELAHFVSPRHDEPFMQVLETMMPTWREIRQELNVMPLAHEPSFDRWYRNTQVENEDGTKHQLFTRLARGVGVRFGEALQPIYFEQLTSERRVVRYARGVPQARFERIKGKRAETTATCRYKIDLAQ